MLRTNGADMNKYIEQQFSALRYEKNILVVEETTSAGGCGSFNENILLEMPMKNFCEFVKS